MRVQVKVHDSAFAPTDEQIDSIALPASIFILVLSHLLSAAAAHVCAWRVAADDIGQIEWVRVNGWNIDDFC